MMRFLYCKSNEKSAEIYTYCIVAEGMLCGAEAFMLRIVWVNYP